MMNAHSMPFSRLIDIDQGAKEHYHFPKYQREYTWNRRQWDQLLLDIEENDSGYFMGSIICIKDGNPPSPGDEGGGTSGPSSRPQAPDPLPSILFRCLESRTTRRPGWGDEQFRAQALASSFEKVVTRLAKSITAR